MLSLCAQMHTNKHMYRDKNTCMCIHALTCPCTRNSLNMLLLASLNRPSSFPQHEHTAIKAIPALKPKPRKLFEVVFWSFKMGETTIRGEWPQEGQTKVVDVPIDWICWEGVLFAWDFLFLLSGAKVSYKDNTYASLETRELLTLFDCLARTNGAVKDTCTKTYARKDVKTRIRETKNQNTCVRPKNASESVTDGTFILYDAR